MKLAQTGLKTDVVNTRCSICRDKDENRREAINRALGRGISHKDIEAMTGTASRTVGNHAAHLPDIYREAKEKSILSQAIDIDAELREQLTFAKDLRVAARKYLSDPNTGEICLFPRSDEISVVYEDRKDTTANGEPKKKTDTLEVLLERAATGGINPTRTITKHVDIRSFSLDAIKVADLVVDKFSKIQGVYQQDRQNEYDFEQSVKLARYMQEDGYTLEQILDFFSRFPVLKDMDKMKLANRLEIAEIETVQ